MNAQPGDGFQIVDRHRRHAKPACPSVAISASLTSLGSASRSIPAPTPYTSFSARRAALLPGRYPARCGRRSRRSLNCTLHSISGSTNYRSWCAPGSEVHTYRVDIRLCRHEKGNARSSSEHWKRWGENIPRNHVQAGKPAPCLLSPNIDRLRRESSRYFADPQRVYSTLSGRTGLERCDVAQQVFSASLRYQLFGSLVAKGR